MSPYHLKKNSETIGLTIGCSISNAVFAKLEGEPVEDFSNGDETDSETKSAEAVKSRNEIHPSHFLRSLKL